MKESKRALILQDVKSGVINLKKASVLLQLSYPQTKRIWRNFKMEGLNGLVSKKRGKKSNRAVPGERRKEIVRVIRDNYLGCKPLFVSEKLRERQNFKYSSEFIRQLMTEYQLWFPKKARRNIHQRRKRREREGELVQMDASDHKWFEDRGPRCHLHLLVDDATSKIYGGYFTEEETTEGYFQACFPYFEERGLPLSFYHDKRGTFKVNNGKKRGDTQFGRAMKELEIGMIYAHSPEAKGRIERVFGTLQERLVWEMRIENISNIEEANRYLPKFFEVYNKKFSTEPANPSNAHRQFNQKRQLKYILCRKESRTISKNLEIQYENVPYQLFVSKEQQAKLMRNKIDVLVTLDGEMRLEHKGQEVKFKRFEEIPYQRKIKEYQCLEIKEKNTTTKKTPIANFHMAVTKRGYIEREEIMSPKEKATATLRLVRRKEDARKENLEILSELKDGTIG